MRRAKIVCTLGPATSTYEAIRDLAKAGMDVARLNLSHGTYDVHSETYQNVRRAAEELGKPIAILVDLQGPKIRLGKFKDGPYELAAGAEFTITTEDIEGDGTQSSTTFKGLPGDCNPGDTLLIDDGRVKLEVVEVDGPRVRTKVVEPGPVSNNKGINLPGVAVSVPAMSDKDEADLRWGMRIGADLIALSFVRDAKDVERVHEIMDESGGRVPVLAKIEKPQAVENLDGIIKAFDGIMVARGDLAVELPFEHVPLVQKAAVTKCRIAGKPVIVATQMLDSMITATRPTRAEASDVANAVLDGADAVMLSGETSVGAHPTLVVDAMSRIVTHAEDHGLGQLPKLPKDDSGSTARAISKAAVDVAKAVDAKFIVAFTETGMSARNVSRHRTSVPILAFTPEIRVENQMALSWGVQPYLVSHVQHTDHMVEQVDAKLLAKGLAEKGDRVVMIAGVPPGIAGTTNEVRVHVVGSGSKGVVS